MKLRVDVNLILRGEAHGVVGWLPHQLIEHMRSRPPEVRALGKALKPDAHEFADRLLSIAADPRRNRGDPVLVPPYLFSEVVLLLLGLPRPQPGRPKKEGTLEALRLRAEGKSGRGAAKAAAAKTGENPENVRRRLRSKKPYKPKRKGGT
jgi:hypothetical protein